MNSRLLSLCKLIENIEKNPPRSVILNKRLVLLKDRNKKLDEQYCIVHFQEACMRLNLNPAELMQIRYPRKISGKKIWKKVIQ